MDGDTPVPSDGPGDVPYQSLYRRFRPGTFAEVRGQDHVVLALRNAVRDGRVAHAYLFSGPRGTGKTSTARILAKALNCANPHDGEPCGECASCLEITRGTSLDVHELDAASNNGVEAMRDLVSRAALGTPGRQKVYIVDEVHMLSTAASNALLKTLEEPPAHVVFVLATTDPQKVLPTIRSRTQHFEFRLLGAETLVSLLEDVRTAAGLELGDEALGLAVRRGRGSARDTLSVLDQLAASDHLDDDLPELGTVAGALADRDASAALVAVSQLVEGGWGPAQLAADLVEYLRQGFLSLVAPDLVALAGTERDSVADVATRLGLAGVVRALETIGAAQVQMRDAPDPRVNLEVSLVRLAHPEADEGLEAVLARLERLERTVAGMGAGGAPAAHPPARSTGGLHGVPAAEVPVPAPGPATEVPSPATEVPAEGSSEPAPRTAAPGGRPTLGALRRQAAHAAGNPPAAPAASPPRGPAPDDQVPAPAAAEPPAAATEPPAAPAATAPAPAPAPAPDGEPGGGAPAVGAPPASGLPSRDQLTEAWGDHILTRLRPKAKALLVAGRFLEVGDAAVFALPNQIHRDRCEEVRPDVEAVLAAHFGRPVPVRMVVEPDGSGGPPSPGAPRSAPVAPERSGGPAAPDRSGGPAGAGSPSAPTEPATTEPSVAAPPVTAPERASMPATDQPPDPEEDLAIFETARQVSEAEYDGSAEARLLRAFPGAEEVR